MKKLYLLIILPILLAAACSKPDNAGTDQWSTYTAPPEQGFSIKYPDNYRITTYRPGEERPGNYLPVVDKSAVVTIFRKDQPGKKTNLDSAGISVIIYNGCKSSGKCYDFENPPEQTARQKCADVTIQNRIFKAAKGFDAGAGHSAGVESFRIFHNNKCYEISFYISETSIENYEPGTVTKFDRKKIHAELEGMLKTFTLR